MLSPFEERIEGGVSPSLKLGTDILLRDEASRDLNARGALKLKSFVSCELVILKFSGSS